MAKFYITTPIYYVNDIPHIGHSYTTIAADVLARYHRSRGDQVRFLTGTDEHGAKIAEAAANRGQTPKQFVDDIVVRFKDAWSELNLSYDEFIRTSDPHHEAGVVAFLNGLYEAGDIYKSIYEGLYCVGCEQYKTAEDLVDGKCPDHNLVPIQYSEENYFFRLSKYRDTLLNALADPTDPNHYVVNPPTRLNEVLGKLRLGLDDLSISRASLTWGVPLAFDPSQVAYVWIDALLNYVTSAGYPDDPEKLARWWPAEIHVIGRDILWFHAILWPAMLIAGGLRPPREVYAHGFFTVGGQRMSKTLGNAIAPAELVRQFGTDAARYLLLTSFPFGTNGDFNLTNLTTRYNAELANDLGNLLNRTISMINRYRQGDVPSPGALATEDAELQTAASALFGHLDQAFGTLDFTAAAEAIRTVVTRANRYVDETAPWKLAKSDSARLDTVLYTLAEAERLVAVGLSAFLPTTTERMLNQLGTTASQSTWGGIVPGSRVTGKPEPLFPRIEASVSLPG